MTTLAVMGRLEDVVDRAAHEHRFSGVVRVDREGEIELATACGLANRSLGVNNTLATRFAIARGGKGLTALAVMSLVEEGSIARDFDSRSIGARKRYDAGVSFRTVHDPDTRLTYTVISNTSEGAWPIARAIAENTG